MSFYSVRNTSRFVNQNQDVNSAQHVQFLRSGFQQPTADVSISDLQGMDLEYTAEEVINRYIVRSNLSGPSMDVFPSAASIVDALNANQWVRASAQDHKTITIQNGFYLDITIINNDSNDTITLVPSVGVTIGMSGNIVIARNSAVVLRMQVLQTAPTPVIYLTLLSTEPTPAGIITPFAGTSAPAGYLMCDGSAVSREVYSTLFSVIGESYGPGDNLLTFNLPDLRGRVPVGQINASPYFGALAVAGGNTDITLTIAQIPAHLHTGTVDSAGAHVHSITDPGHAHNYYGVQSQGAASGGDNVAENNPRPLETSSTNTTGISVNSAGAHQHTFTSTTTGGSQSHSNVQPYLTINYIIKF